jgi:hypothetical protein
MVYFYLEGLFPKILIAFIDGGVDEDGGKGGDTFFSQRCNLTEGQQAHLHDILPIIGVPFITRLTMTNIDICKTGSSLSVTYISYFLSY